MGLVVLCDPSSGEADDHLMELLTQHILDSATGDQPQPPLTQDDFKPVWE